MAEHGHATVFTVREVTAYIKRLFDSDEVLQDVIVRGEVSNFRAHRSGHLYFTLKDEDAALDCVCFRNVAAGLDFEIKDGMQLVAAGRITVYEKQGRYQLIAEHLRPDGLGALYLAFERLKAKLEAEGLFDPSRKRPLPAFPRCIALVTSPTGAAVEDMKNIISRRYPLARIIVFPTLVQGEDAPASIVASLEAANSHEAVDVIIVGRGGGSIEDLWAFNDERVARAIFASRKPVVSAVGHETDVTIADLVADLRAPTPSAAAELVVPEVGELLGRVEALARHARTALRERLRHARGQLAEILARPPMRNPRTLVEQWTQRLDEASAAAEAAVRRLMEQAGHRLRLAAARLEAHRPHRLLERRRERLEALDHRLHIALVRAVDSSRASLDSLGHRLRLAMVRAVGGYRARLAVGAARLEANHPRRQVAHRREALLGLARRAGLAICGGLAGQRARLDILSGRLAALNPRAVLDRGYSITLRLPDEIVVRSAAQVAPPDALRILLAEGELRARTTEALPPEQPTQNVQSDETEDHAQ